uniref:Uncharacterized protein n=1 Tax=Hyaloperonospora arabidopsidis (strain Emoy2) TaxID=559515 RepID=M4BVR9_HYAAE
MSSQGIHATSPDTVTDLCDDAASEAFPHGTASSLARQATQEGVGVSIQVHEDLVSEVASEVTQLRESFDHVQTTLDQSVDERKQPLEILDQVRRAREQSSTELAQLREQMNRLGSIKSVHKRLRKVEYNLPRLNGQMELLTKMNLTRKTSFLQRKRLPVHERRIMIWLMQANVKLWVCAQRARNIECIGKAFLHYDRERPDEAWEQLCLEDGRDYR